MVLCKFEHIKWPKKCEKVHFERPIFSSFTCTLISLCVIVSAFSSLKKTKMSVDITEIYTIKCESLKSPQL